MNRAARDLATGVWDLPAAVVTAVQLALQGQFSEALTAIADSVIGPIVAAGQSVVSAATYVLTNLVARAGAVVAALPQILTTFAGTALGGVSVLTQKTIAIVTGVMTSLTTLDFEDAWNTAVGGLLGPSGIPGALLNLTTGAGVQTGPILDPATDIPANFVPSVRTSLQAAQWTIRDALQTDVECGCAVAENRAAAAAAPAVGTSAAAGDSPSQADIADTSDTADTTGIASSSGRAASGRADRTRDHARRAAADRARG